MITTHYYLNFSFLISIFLFTPDTPQTTPQAAIRMRMSDETIRPSVVFNQKRLV